ncbi:hypothetical protein [Weissella hellenica]|uniref:hypothetical protein n=1 Tax=Weissella hellenica TaxID=46256 RepID=UPI00163C011B
MKKNLLNKVINSHNKEEQHPGTWLYSADGVQGYVTSDGEFIDMRDNIRKETI